MKKSLLLLAFITACAFTQAQLVTSFATEHNKFMKDLNQYMTQGKMETNVKTMEEFQKLVVAAKLSSPWLDEVIATSNLMVGRLMAPYPHFNNYLNAVVNAVKSGKSDAQFSDWNKILSEIIDNQKKGDNNDFLKFVEFSNGFFKEGALLETGAKTWKVATDQYTFAFEDGKPSVKFPTTTLMGCVKGDTLMVKQTSGNYFPLETKWVGKSARVDWARPGLDPNKVYCTFGEYTVNTSTFGYSVDTVTFHHADYFSKALLGKFTDKMVTSADSNNMTYPRFASYAVGMTLKDIAPNVTYTGGFTMNGSKKVIGYGSPEEKGQLTFYARDGKTKILQARSQNLVIKKGVELEAAKAEVSIYFGTDSIYHPEINLIYKVAKREMRLLRGETGLSMAHFTDSYHNDEFQTDAIFWNLDSSVLNLKILSGVGKKPGIYESVNYFNKEMMRKTQGVASYEPLSVLKKLYEKTGSREVNTVDYARALDPALKEGEVKSLLYDLVANGFIMYNEDQGIVTIKDKAINYVLAKARRIDYDIITIKSAPQSGNDAIDLKSSNIDLKGVFEVPISDTAYVYFRPKNHSISLQKDRNMQFDGLIYAGRLDFIGEKLKFQYAPFTVELTKVDTMRLNVPDSDKVDKYGDPVLKPMKSKVEGLKGLLEVDAPINKSGRTRLPQFPRLTSREKSFIYYDDPAIAKGAYTRKNFFFQLEPFKLDSLNNFTPGLISWQGMLVSGGIFPDIKDSVRLQGDASLGFKSETPPGGYDLYKGKGKYYGKYELNYSGLQGDGRITHSTADFTTHDVRLYPDSMRGTIDTFTLAKTFEGVQTPSVVGTSDMIFWRPANDSMHIYMNDKDKPFAMYDDSLTSFKGNMLLTDKGLRGNGTLDWDQATLASKDISFRTMDLSSDTAALNIKTTGDRVTFKTPNVRAKVDFKTRIGDFKSNQQNIPTEFSYNQYTTAINEFKWFMDEKILDFKAPAGGPGEYFTSTRPDQKGLKYLGKRATYNLVSSVLRIEGVPGIKVADGTIIPDSGVVVVEGEAKMHQLLNATIIADTALKYHKFDSCTVDIFSKESFKGTGNYQYITKGIDETIPFGDISTRALTVGTHRKAHDVWNVVAKAHIEATQNFVLYPKVSFSGDASVVSTDPSINFKGYAKIGYENPKVVVSDFIINQDVDPKKLNLQYTAEAKNSSGNKVSAGIHISPVPDAPAIYTTLMSPKRENKDIAIFKTSGIIAQLPSGEYAFGTEKKIRDNDRYGNMLVYNDKKGTVKAEGNFDLGTNFGLVRTVSAGTADVKLDSGKYNINLTIGIDLQMADKAQERLEFYMAGDNPDMPDLTYEKDNQKKAIYELSDPKSDKGMLDEFEKTSQFAKRPKALYHNLVFNDVNFVFDSDDISLRSTGKIGVAMVGKKVLNKKLNGYIEIQYKGGLDIVTIYLVTGTKGWFYFEYQPGTLSVLSSYDDFNNNIIAVAADKRKIKGSNNKFYMYGPASPAAKADFVDYMKDKANGISRPRPIPKPVSQEAIPTAGDTSGLGGLPGDTTGMTPEQKERLEIDKLNEIKANGGNILSGPPADRLKKEQEELPPMPDQQNINKIEEMKQNGGSILSGPPPDRIKPAPKQDSVPPANPAPVQQQQTPDQNAVPVNQPPVQPQETPKQDVVPVNPPPVVPQETPKQDVPKTDTVQPKSDAPKQDPVPVQQTPVQETVPVNQPPVQQQEAPKKDTIQPKSDVPKQETVPVNQPPVQQEAPKQDAVPVNQAPVQQQETPKQETVIPPVTPAVTPLSDTLKTTNTAPAPVKQDSIPPAVPK